MIISDAEIGYCGLYEADYMMVMSQEAYDKYNYDLHDESVLIIDPDLIKEVEQEYPIGINGTAIAEELGNKIVANIVMLGAFNRAGEIVPQEALEESVKDRVPSKFRDLNMKALQRGIDVVEEYI